MGAAKRGNARAFSKDGDCSKRKIPGGARDWVQLQDVAGTCSSFLSFPLPDRPSRTERKILTMANRVEATLRRGIPRGPAAEAGERTGGGRGIRAVTRRGADLGGGGYRRANEQRGPWCGGALRRSSRIRDHRTSEKTSTSRAHHVSPAPPVETCPTAFHAFPFNCLHVRTPCAENWTRGPPHPEGKGNRV